MGNRLPGLAGIVNSPTIGSYNRSSLNPRVGGLLDSLGSSGFGDLAVSSGFRSPTSNAMAGGAKRSQHLSGNAIDISTRGMSEAQKGALLSAAAKAGAKGFGVYSSGNSLHLDMRDTPAAWGLNGSYNGAPLSKFPGWVQTALGPTFGAKPVTQPQAPISGPVNALAGEAPVTGAVGAVNGMAGRSRMPGAAATASTGIGAPSIPAAPSQPGIFGEGGWVSRNQSGLLGGLLGTAALGPVGGLLGGLLGNAISNGSKGTMSSGAKAAMNAGWDGFSGMSSAQSAAARGITSGSQGSASASRSGGGGLLGGIGSAIGSALGSLSSKGSGAASGGSGSYGSSPNRSGQNGNLSGGSKSSSSSSGKSGSSGGKKK